MLAGEPVGGELVLRQMRRLGVHWPVIGGDGLTGIESRGALAEGVRVSVSYLPDRRGPKNAAFTAEYARTYNGQRPDDTVAGTYDVVMLLAQAIEAAGSDRRAIRDIVMILSPVLLFHVSLQRARAHFCSVNVPLRVGGYG